MRYSIKWPEYAKQWNAMIINPSRQKQFDDIARKQVSLKNRYLQVQTLTNVPWYSVALTHLREADNDFSKGLAQGDPWNRRSTHEPICGPFNSFNESCVWALKHDGMTSVHDWRLEKILYWEEIFNGMGYDMRGLPSPYIWGGTNIQKPGKYVEDHVFSKTRWDMQPGVAPILFTMSKIDNTIVFTRED